MSTSLQFTIHSCLMHCCTVPENGYILMEKVHTKIMVYFVPSLIKLWLSLLMISVSLPFNDTLKGRLATERDMNTLEE